MFITVAKASPVLIFLFSCFSYLEQLGYDLLGAVETGNIGMVGRLLFSGISADVRNNNEYNRTPLHLTAYNNNTEVAQLLIAHKADIEARDEYNRTPLHYAAWKNSTEVAQLLIAHKADIEARDEDNRTPLEVARNFFMDTEAVIRLLMEHAANIS